MSRARNGLQVVQFFERGGGNLAPHVTILEALELRILFMEQQVGQHAFSTKKEKQISQIIFKFNKALTVSREAGNAWLYAISCEIAAEFYEQMMLKPLAKAHIEVLKAPSSLHVFMLLQEAMSTYTALEAMAKVKQLETIMSHTTGLIVSSTNTNSSCPSIPAWPFLSRITKALLSYPANSSLKGIRLQAILTRFSRSYSEYAYLF